MSDDPASIDAFKWECRRKQVESLRIPWEGMGAMANTERHIAALTIENLMEEAEACKKDMQKAERDIAALRDQLEVEESSVNHLHTDRNNLRLEVERLRAERDEARRMYCEAVILHGTAHRFDANGVPEEITEAEELARRLKWDCFKEKSND